METRPESHDESLAATSPLLEPSLLLVLLLLLAVMHASSSEETNCRLGEQFSILIKCVGELIFFSFSSSGNNRDMDAI